MCISCGNAQSQKIDILDTSWNSLAVSEWKAVSRNISDDIFGTIYTIYTQFYVTYYRHVYYYCIILRLYVGTFIYTHDILPRLDCYSENM